MTGGLQPDVFAPSAPTAFFVNAITNSVFGTAGGNYYMTVTDSCNQSAVVPFILTVCDTEEPNVFTPNGDEINDVFEISGLGSFPGSQLRIFNRWGTMVFESLDYTTTPRLSAVLNEMVSPWDAAEVEEGVYFWIFNRSDGISREGYVHVMHKKP